MASIDDFALEHRFLVLKDYDQTDTENFQQAPLFEAFFDNIRKEHHGRIIPKKDNKGRPIVIDGKFVPELDEQGNPKTISIEKPLDYFKVSDYYFRPKDGIGYLELMKRDIRKGVFPITKEDLRHYGSKVQLSPGLPDFYHALKKEWAGKCYIHTAILSVGILDMILGSPVAAAVDEVIASDLFSLDDPNGLSETFDNVTPFTKIERIISMAKGGLSHINELFRKYEYLFRHTNMICTGDGMSDVNHFAYAGSKGSTIMCVYKDGDLKARETAQKNDVLMKRIHYLLPRNYTVGSVYWNQINERIEKLLSSKCTFNRRTISDYKKRRSGNRDLEECVRKHLDNCEECSFYMKPVRVY